MVVVDAVSPGAMEIVVAHPLHWVGVLRDRIAGVGVKSLKFPTASPSLEEHREVAPGWTYMGPGKTFPELFFSIEGVLIFFW